MLLTALSITVSFIFSKDYSSFTVNALFYLMMAEVFLSTAVTATNPRTAKSCSVRIVSLSPHQLTAVLHSKKKGRRYLFFFFLKQNLDWVWREKSKKISLVDRSHN